MLNRSLAAALAASAVAVGACGGGNEGADTGPLTTKEVFQKTRPATISLSGRQGESINGGTGIIFDKQKGLAITNAHVVQGLASLEAKVLDRETVPAQVVGVAPCQDLAVVKLNTVPRGAGEVEIGRSGRAANQDEVTALGYPSSFEDPEAQKVISTNGNIQSPDISAAPSDSMPEFPHVIQHSATINPGNSGGPLFNDRAELVGINTLYNPGEERPIENQFYAITTDHAMPIVRQLARGEDQANPGWNIAAFFDVPLASFFEETGFGTAELGQAADEYLAREEVNGVLVTGVEPGSPAEEAQVVEGDLLTALKGTPVTNVADVCEVLQSARPGETLETQGKFISSSPNGIADLGKDWSVEMKLPQ